MIPTELSSEGGPQPSLSKFEAELREMRLSLLMEIEKRKQAEEALSHMRSQWQQLRQQFSVVGLTLPAELTVLAEGEQLDCNPAEEILQQLHVSRFVSESIGRGVARAEVEMELGALIESKNFEIARLTDRVHFYEVVNREMYQRNQDALGQISIPLLSILLSYIFLPTLTRHYYLFPVWGDFGKSFWGVGGPFCKVLEACLFYVVYSLIILFLIIF